MRKFASLNPKTPEGSDAEIIGEGPIVELKETPGKITISYIFPGFYVVDDSHDVDKNKVDFKQINIPAMGSMAESGKPLLPSFGRYVQIPPTLDYDITVEKGEPIVFEGIEISPAQQKLTDSPSAKSTFEYDSELYAKDTLYPKEIVRVSGPFELDQYSALLLHLTPFQYNPAEKKLTGYGNITVTIEFKSRKRGAKGEAKSPLGVGADKAAFGNLLLNPGSGIESRLNFPERPITRSPLVKHEISPQIRHGPEFLIIYAQSFEAAAKKLAKWKNMRGLLTTIVSIDSIGNNVSKIKSYVRNKKKENPDLGYVLLLGDSDEIIAETIPGGPWGSNITDYYYSTKTDSSGPSSYVFPWLAIGRIPVQKESDAMGVVDQIISYEKNPPADPSYYRKMAFAAFFQDDDMDNRDNRGFLKTMEDIRSVLVPIGYNIERIYVTNNKDMQFYYDGAPIPADVKNAIIEPAIATKMLVEATAEGQLFIGHRDHGAPEGWAHPPFTVADLNMVKGNTPTIFYSINCLTGQFDENPSECFAEKNLRMEGGAPSLIAATRVSNTWLNNDLEKALFDATFGGVIPTFPGGTASYPITHNRLGDILNYAKSYLPIGMSGGPEYIKDHCEIYHVIGDPTIELWTDTPRLVKVKASLKTILKKTVLDILLSECPKLSVLTIWADDKMIRKLEPSSAHITVSLDSVLKLPASRLVKALYVCFHAPGCRYSEVNVKQRGQNPFE